MIDAAVNQHADTKRHVGAATVAAEYLVRAAGDVDQLLLAPVDHRVERLAPPAEDDAGGRDRRVRPDMRVD